MLCYRIMHEVLWFLRRAGQDSLSRAIPPNVDLHLGVHNVVGVGLLLS